MNGDDVITETAHPQGPAALSNTHHSADVPDTVVAEASVGVASAHQAGADAPVPEVGVAPDTPVLADGTDAPEHESAVAAATEDVEGAAAFDDDELSDDQVRRRLVSQFETWLDRMAQGEPPPDGIPEELLADALETPEAGDALGSDLYTLFAGLTTLSGEIRLQGRAFKQMADVLAPTAQVPGRLDRIEAAQSAVARELARRAEPDNAELPGSQEALEVLFDLYDRLNRGLRNFDAGYDAARAQNASMGPVQRLLGRRSHADQLAAPAAAMREGYRLTLSRLEAAFLQWGIQRIGEVGEPFDPQRMAVVDVGPGPGMPDGSVMEVYRSGYVLNGRVLATARVKVARAGQSG